MYRRMLAAFVMVLACLTGCERIKAWVGKQGAAGTDPAASEATEARVKERTEAIVAKLFEEANRDPAVTARLDAVLQKVFADPAVDLAMQGLVEQCLGDPDVQSRLGKLLEQVVKDPAVVKKLQALTAGASSQAEIEARMEKYMAGVMNGPAVQKAIEGSIDKIMADPRIDHRLTEIFSAADLVPSAQGDPSLDAASRELDAKFATATVENSEEAFLSGWQSAATADPNVKKQAREALMACFDAIGAGTELKDTIRAGFDSPRTRKILAKALSDVLDDPGAAAAAADLFKVLMLGALDPTITTQRINTLLDHPKVVSRLRDSILELLSSEPGAKRLQDSFRSALRVPEAKARLFAFVEAMLKAAPSP